ncbi:peptide deformylase [Rhodocista pekingensis]|uniref:Peptide deformylase n=1 Tax=Rhodocista pekingensis TaxID=201185 RepID=A0ABW2KUN7_9PROT
MSLLNILIVPDARLRQTATPVTNVDGRVARLMDDMLETMYKAPGIGLAAPQVGVLERVIVMDIAERKTEAPNPILMANPEIIARSDELATAQEGCLSIPDIYADVTRPRQVRVRYVDRAGEVRELDADGLTATCVQHEIDHLNGVLFVDYLSALKRSMLLRRLQKMQRNKAAG